MNQFTFVRANKLLVAPLTAISLLAIAVGCKGSSEKGQNATPAAVMATSGAVKVTVTDEGFQPSSVHAKLSQPLTLEFTRTSDKTCATQVAFPELHINKELPLNTPVAIQVPTDKARTLTFQCGMGMYKSSVVISNS